MSDPFFSDRRRGRDRSFDAHRQRGRGFFDDHLLNAGFPFDRGFDDMTNPGRGRTRVYSQVSRSTVTPDGRFVSESKMTRTVNGVTESVWKRKDESVCPLLRLHRLRLTHFASRRATSMLRTPIQTVENGTRSTGVSNLRSISNHNDFNLLLHRRPRRRSKLHFHHPRHTRT